MRAASWHVRAARWVSVTDLMASRRHWAQARQWLIGQADSPERSQLLLAVSPELLTLFDLLGAETAEAATVFQQSWSNPHEP